MLYSILINSMIADYENWSGYRPGQGKFEPDVDIDPSLCSHIMYSFATLNANTHLLDIFDAWADLPAGGGKGNNKTIYYIIFDNYIYISVIFIYFNISYSYFSSF